MSVIEDTPATLSPVLRRQALQAGSLTLLGTAFASTALMTAVDGTPTMVLTAVSLPVLLFLFAGPSLPLHGQPALGPANAVTLVRAVGVALIASLLGERVAVGLVWPLMAASAAALVLDGLDGRIARKTGTASPFGARLDMELDALFTMVLAGLVWQLDRAGAWVLASGALRYLFVAASWVWPWMNRPLFPSRRRAWVCGIQVGCLVLALAPGPQALPLAASGLVALVYSFGVDTLWLARRRKAA